MATESMYLKVPSKQALLDAFNQEFPECDVRIIIGKLKTHHITFGSACRCDDGQLIFEIPGSLEDENGWHTKIKATRYADKLKTRAEAQALVSRENI